ncbi:hypothetical protein ACFUJR_32995 [Streptomyces sp. NPDC057271]|uniref:golvesin C-terminal-like domain-containing protein n=1 Tax=unclassified Streptomyces TaxID=2593676 RepID=UPI0036389E42
MSRFVSSVFLSLTVMAPQATAVALPEPVRDPVTAAEHTDDLGGEVALDVRLGKFTRAGSDWVVSSATDLLLHERSDNNVKISYRLSRREENQGDEPRMVHVGERQVFDGPVAQGKREMNLVLGRLSKGRYLLTVHATAKQSESLTWGDEGELRFEASSAGVSEGWKGVGKRPAAESDPSYASDLPSRTYCTPQDNGTCVCRIGYKVATQCFDHYSEVVELAGKVNYVNRTGGTEVVREAVLRILDADRRTIGTGFTGEDGTYNVSYTTSYEANVGCSSDPRCQMDRMGVFLHLITSDGKSIDVLDKDGAHYEFSLGNSYYWTYGGYVETTIDPVDPVYPLPSWKSIWVYMDAIRTRRLITLEAANDPGKTTIQWWADRDAGSYYTPGGRVMLRGGAPDDNFTTIHEIAHNYMYNVYGSLPNTPNCSPHTLTGVSSSGCAWVEGWADYLPTVVNNSPVINPRGTTINLDHTGSFGLRETGADLKPIGWETEGRVAGALWDLTRAYDFSTVYGAFLGSQADSFEDLWKHWVKIRNPLDAMGNLEGNKIFFAVRIDDHDAPLFDGQYPVTSALGWWVSTTEAGSRNGDYRVHTPGSEGTFSFYPGHKLTEYNRTSGRYDVFVKFPAVTDQSTTTTYKVYSGEGITTKAVDQTAQAGQWVWLGTYYFAQSSSYHNIKVMAGADENVTVDEVVFSKV